MSERETSGIRTPADVVAAILGERREHQPEGTATAYAPANIALCKYWGKRDEILNLPVTSSLSISLGQLGSHVSLAACDGPDTVTLNGDALAGDSPFVRRVIAFLDLFRAGAGVGYRVATRNTIPTAAGFASSASGFAALVSALDGLHAWKLSGRERSILARLGSGSACRSVYTGLVEWHAGGRDDGMDSFAEPIGVEWPELRIALVVVSEQAKAVGSREGMAHTAANSPLYAAWPAAVARDLRAIKGAITQRDFGALGEAVERNALSMHATMMAAQPPLLYWMPESVAVMQTVWRCRHDGLAVYFTMDAGPNVKLLYLASDEEAVRGAFANWPVVTASAAINT